MTPDTYLHVHVFTSPFCITTTKCLSLRYSVQKQKHIYVIVLEVQGQDNPERVVVLDDSW